MLPLITQADVSEKKVFLRADLDAPLHNGHVEDETRLLACTQTLSYLLEKNATVILAGHAGRPGGKQDEKLSLEPIAGWMAHKFNLSLEEATLDSFSGWKLSSSFFVLENLRFDLGEEGNDPLFSKRLASLADIYVNDAFAMCHRTHASMVGVASFLPHYAGFHLQKEIAMLEKVMTVPKRPLVVVIGGEKIETKLPLVEKMASIADVVLVGGKIAQKKDQLQKVFHGKKAQVIIADLIQSSEDITPKSVEHFIHILANAATIVWNGPMGLIREEDSDNATKRLAGGVANTQAFKVVGGGDTIEYLRRINVLSSFDFVSTGGGAMLAFLSGEELPGLRALSS